MVLIASEYEGLGGKVHNKDSGSKVVERMSY
jgi:hypothetical protein